MRPIEEIKKSLKCCTEASCSECPYDDGTANFTCLAPLAHNALEYIEQLEKALSYTSEGYAHLSKRNDELARKYYEMRRYYKESIGCNNCLYKNVQAQNEPCRFCKDLIVDGKEHYWEWDGLEEEHENA